jgi:threonylcarbamoyladenosine tRNA methylthiotransferase CDKAL1
MIETIAAVVDDIEDAWLVPLEQRPVRASKQDFVVHQSSSKAAVPEEVKRTVPGVQTVYVRTFGCSHNTSDSEYMMGILQEYGYR